MKAELIAVMPVYNEQDNIAGVVQEWLAAFAAEGIEHVLIAVNDGSKDRTLDLLNRLQSDFPERLEIITKANSGHGRSCRVGYEAALAWGAPWIFQFDSDGQCDPRFFSAFWQSRDEADAIFGCRTTRMDGFSRLLVSKACRFATFAVTGQDLKDPNVPYRLMRQAALQRALEKIPATFDLHNIALSVALKRDPQVRCAYIPIIFRSRQGGRSSLNLPRIIRAGWKMLKQLGDVKV